MASFSKTSKERLETCDPRLQALFSRVIKITDCTILVGHRDQVSQNQAFQEGKSKLKWPESKHNKKPSLAVDASPYPIPKGWERPNFDHFAGVVRAIAWMLDIPIRWGGDWNRNWDTSDQQFNDLVHFEIDDEGQQ